MNEDLAKYAASLNATISSILGAIIAFMFSAHNNLRGRGLSELERFYRITIIGLIIIFLLSIASFSYFLLNIYRMREIFFSPWDRVFSFVLILILPIIAIYWLILYIKG